MSKRLHSLEAVGLVGALLVATPPASATIKAAVKAFADPKAEQALVYFIREPHMVGKARTMFLYADEVFLGVLDNDTYTFVHVDPGAHLFWLNWAKINQEVELEAGKTYYFNVFDTFDRLDEESAKGYLGAAKFYVTPDDKERATSVEHIRERHGKAEKVAAKKPDEPAPPGSDRKREEHVAKWPRVDLTAYAALYVEDFAMKDRKAEERKKEHLIESAPRRLALAVIEAVGADVFAQIHQGAAPAEASDAVVLRGEITQYKPGSESARLMLAGTGSAHLDFAAELVAASSGEVLGRLAGDRTWAWGGAHGASKGIDDLERNVAYEIALYLKRCKGIDETAPAAETP